MSDVAAVVLAVAVWIGALAGAPVPRWLAVVVVIIAFLLRRPALLVAGGALLASSLAAAAWAGLQPPSSVNLRADALLVSDPVGVGPALRVDLRVGGRRVEGWASGNAASALRDRLAGEVVGVAGRLRAPPDGARARLAVRHIAARMTIEEVGRARSGSWAARAANDLRRLVARGTTSIEPGRRALLSGFLIGDDRGVPPPIEADFRASGLTHLLAVSGQNVAFVLAIAGPGLRRVQLRGRLVGSLAVIGLFAVVTRAEPSVLRASAMAAIACSAAFVGRPVSRTRILALAVAGLVLVDPLLVRSVGFRLSVGASAGLALLARPIAARLAGPRWVAEPLAVTCAAQLGVAPVLLTTFGSMPVVTVAANLLAVPIAGPLTAWGLTAGFVAGVMGGSGAAILHIPTELMVAWIAGVARGAARVPVGSVDASDLAVVAMVVVLTRRWRRVLVGATAVALLVAARPPSTSIDGAEMARGAHLWRAGATVLVIDGASDGSRLLEELRRAGVTRLDLVVARRGSRSLGGTLVDLRSRIRVRAIAAPVGHHIRDATAVDRPVSFALGRLVVELRPGGAVLGVTIRETAGDGGRARGPPP